MQALFFWKDWAKPYRLLWLTFSFIFIASLVFMWFSYFQGASGIIDWKKHQEQKTIETTVHNFRLGPFQLAVPGESYVIVEFFQGGDLHHNFTASYIFLAVFALAFVLLMAVITTLDRFWYLASMSLFIILIVSLRFDVLWIFNLKGLIMPIVIIVLYGSVSYYFKGFNPAASFLNRFFAFLLLTIILYFIILFFSSAQYPFIHLTVTAYTPALVLSILFIVMVAHEILVSFVYVTNQRSGNGVKHFSIISFIYLFNVILAALHELNVVQWNIMYVNVYLLLTCSALLGIWGFRLREPVFENIFPFAPFGGYFFIGLGTICFITIGQLLGNWNDPALKIIRDIILFSHAGYGIIFVIYFVSNFMALMADNHPVYKILYKPNRMPYFTFRFAGLIAMLAFVFYSQWRQYIYHGIAGFYNYVADLYMLQDEGALAVSFYEQSHARGFQNNRANYVLATIKASRYNFDEAIRYYDYANRRRTTEFSLVNRGNIHFWTGRYFEAIENFRDAEEIIPNAPALLNNTGYAYSKVHALDSASHYYSKAQKHALTRNAAEANFLALAALEYIPINTDSVINMLDNPSASTRSNALALATLFNQPLNLTVDPLAHTELDLYSATELNNYIIRHAKELDSTFVNQALKIASDSINTDYSEALKASIAHACYHQGNVYKALEILGELAYISSSHKGKYNYIMGLWTLEQGNPEIAASYFSHAETADYKDAPFYYAVALTESGQYTQALTAWDTVAQRNDDEQRTLATQIKRILTATPEQVLSLKDPEKYQFCRYRLGLNDTTLFTRVTNTFENVNYKAQALLDMTRKQFKADRLAHAIHYLNKVSGLELTDKRLFDEIRFIELQLLASRKEIRTLAAQINKGVTFDTPHNLEKLLYTALISESSGDTGISERNYALIATQNPYFETGILAAAEFFKAQDTTSMRPYTILVDAIQVNPNSIRLLKAYVAEASRKGFDEFASSAADRLAILQARVNQ